MQGMVNPSGRHSSSMRKIEDHCEETVRSICQTLRRANEFAKDSK